MANRRALVEVILTSWVVIACLAVTTAAFGIAHHRAERRLAACGCAR